MKKPTEPIEDRLILDLLISHLEAYGCHAFKAQVDEDRAIVLLHEYMKQLKTESNNDSN